MAAGSRTDGGGSAYRSRVDRWLGAVMVLYLLAAAAGVTAAVRSGTEAGVMVGAATAAVVLGTLALTIPMRYRIGRDQLSIRSGLLVWRVPLHGILEVRPVRGWMSAPAWSVDRLRVTYEKGGREREIEIAPEPRSAFLRRLQIAASLHRDGNHLVRPEGPRSQGEGGPGTPLAG